MQTNPVPDLLIDVLREAFALYAMTHLFHWNVRGPNFPQLHKLMNDQYGAIWEELDTLAERARGVGTLIPADVFVAPKAPARRPPSPRPTVKLERRSARRTPSIRKRTPFHRPHRPAPSSWMRSRSPACRRRCCGAIQHC